MAEPTVRLTDEQVAFLHEHGYLSLEQLSPPDEIAWMKGVYDRLFATRAGHAEGNHFDLAGSDDDQDQLNLPQILGPSRYAPELAETVLRANVARIAQQVLGAAAGVGGDHAILKPPSGGVPTPWHQDEAYWDPSLEYRSVSVWVPLQDAPVEAGCLHFVPGTHRLPVLPHHTIGHDPRVHALEIDPSDQYDLSTAVACPLPAGGATLHFSRTLHYAGPNHSPEPRRAFIIGFGLPAAKRSEPRSFWWNETKQTAREQRAREHRERQAQAAR